MIVMVTFHQPGGKRIYVNPEQVVAVRPPLPDEYEQKEIKAVIVGMVGHWGVTENMELAVGRLTGERSNA